MKDKDEIKAYFDRHREEFDDAQPPDLWGKIEDELPAERKEVKMVPLRVVWQVAAGVAILIGAAWIFSLRESNPDNLASEGRSNTPTQQVVNEYPELEEAGIYYQTKIDAAGEELQAYALDEEDYESMKILEDELDALRESLGSEPDDEQVVEAMIQIYRFKLDLMQDLLKQLKNEPQNGEDEDIVVVPL
ncbi:hypothetical protein O3Q51_00305 [Cryomorphaceae bacterium 1068]|nr:hypothetical protein [Cryomorphaceae bacterium 1068]